MVLDERRGENPGIDVGEVKAGSAPVVGDDLVAGKCFRVPGLRRLDCPDHGRDDDEGRPATASRRGNARPVRAPEVLDAVDHLPRMEAKVSIPRSMASGGMAVKHIRTWVGYGPKLDPGATNRP